MALSDNTVNILISEHTEIEKSRKPSFPEVFKIRHVCILPLKEMHRFEPDLQQ